MSWLILSVCPSVCGWNAVDKFVVIPSFLCSSVMNFDANCGPLSEIIFLGNPCFANTCCMYSSAIPSLVMVVRTGTMTASFVSLQAHTKIALYPFNSGSGPMMSLVTISHGSVGTSFGWMGLNGLK